MCRLDSRAYEHWRGVLRACLQVFEIFEYLLIDVRRVAARYVRWGRRSTTSPIGVTLPSRDLFFTFQDQRAQCFNFRRHDVDTASRARETPVLPLGEALPAVTDVKRFEVVRDQHPLNRDVLLQSAA